MFGKSKACPITEDFKFARSNENGSPQKVHNILKRFTGLFMLAFASCILTVSNVFVKKMSYISPSQLSMMRFIGARTCALPIAVYSTTELRMETKDRLQLALRGLLDATGLYLNLTAYRYLPLSQAAIINSTMPAVTTIFARVYLKEPSGCFQWLAVLLSTAGVLLSVRLPALLADDGVHPADLHYVYGVVSAVSSVVVFSVSTVLLREMRHVPASVSLAYIGFFGMLENAVISACSSGFVDARCGGDRYGVLLVWASGFLGFGALTVAVRLEPASVVTVGFTSLNVVLAVALDAAFLDFGSLDGYVGGGAALIMLSVGYLGLQKWVASLPEESRKKKRFRFLLL